MRSVTLEIRLLELPIRTVLAAAHGVGTDTGGGLFRKLTEVKLTDDSAGQGWGECSALNAIGYSSESAKTAFDLLSADPRLDDEGHWRTLVDEAPMAMASLEMAEYDMRLKAASVSLATFLGVDHGVAPAGAAIGLGPLEDTERSAAEAYEAGFRRVKLKIAPSDRLGFPPATLVRAVARDLPDLEIHTDGNGSFDRSNASEIDAVLDAGATLVEQPFHPAKLHLAADLVKRGAMVLADEAATDRAAVESLVDAGACSGIVVKSSRLGGLYPTLEVLGWCEENRVPVCAGGMQESGLGRAALAVLAAHPACTIVGDVGPARRWLSGDPWDDLEMVEHHVVVPTGPGVAPPPDPGLIEEFTVQQATRTLTRTEGSP